MSKDLKCPRCGATLETLEYDLQEEERIVIRKEKGGVFIWLDAWCNCNSDEVENTNWDVQFKAVKMVQY